jgi:hypothetical protein
MQQQQIVLSADQWAQFSGQLMEISTSIKQEQERSQLLLSKLAGLEAELKTLRQGLGTIPDKTWAKTSEAAVILGLSKESATASAKSQVITGRINSGVFPPYNEKTGKGCWRAVGSGSDRVRYKVHIPNCFKALEGNF